MRGAESLAATDQELLTRVRAGDTGAYGELWRRHAGAVTAILRLETRLDADDLTAEVFTRILSAIRSGNGPDAAFRPYALVAARNLAAEWGRRSRREIPVPEDSLDADSGEPPIDESAVVLPHRHVAARVFSSLPVRWQEVLWYLEVEQLTAAEAAPLVGLTPNSTVQLAFRAREGFRQAWIQEHLVGRPAGTHDCAWVDRRVGRYVRGKLASIERGKLERHAAACQRCSDVVEEGRSVERRAIFVALPVLILGGAAPAYLATAADERTRRSDSGPAGDVEAGSVRLAKRSHAVRRGARRGGEAGVGRKVSNRVAASLSAGGLVAAIVLVVVGMVFAQSSVEPAEVAQAAEPATAVGVVKPTPRASVGPETGASLGTQEQGARDDDATSPREPAEVGAPSVQGSPPVPSPSSPSVTPSPVTFVTATAFGQGSPSLSGVASPNGTIEALIDPTGVALSLVTVADAAGNFQVVVDVDGLSGTVQAIVRQIVDGAASAWSASVTVVIPEPPRGIWRWGAPGQIVIETTSVIAYETIEVRVDGVVIGMISSNAASGETFVFATTSTSPAVTMNYAIGASPAPRSVVPEQP